MNDMRLQIIGKLCQNYRKKLNVKQIEVALETGYSLENVSAFENGRNNNANIYNWYVQKGFTYTRKEYDEIFDNLLDDFCGVPNDDKAIEEYNKLKKGEL